MRICKGLGVGVILTALAVACSCSTKEQAVDTTDPTTTASAEPIAITSELRPGCYRSTRLGTDNLFEGPINSVDNAVDYESVDGTCTGNPAGSRRTLVSADSKAVADELCDSLGLPPAGSLDGAEAGYPAPEYVNVWRCAG